MATLKGLFEPKPRSQRNFLIENIREVKTKSSSNSKKNKETPNQLQKKSSSASSFRTLPQSNLPQRSASRQRIKQSVDNRHEKKLPQHSKKDICNANCPCGHPSRSSRPPVNSARTVHYIHQENVPFEWTEVCPSLISHNICHQGVQTEESKLQEMDKARRPMGTEDLVDSAFDSGDQSHRTVSSTKPHETKFYDEQRSPRLSDYQNHITVSGDSMDKIRVDCIKDNERIEFNSHLPTKVGNFQNKEMEIELNCQGPGRNNTDKLSVQQISNKKSSCLASNFEDLKVSTYQKLDSNGKLASDPTLAPSSYRKGVVPKYLSKKKSEQALASALANEIDPNCPPGHVVMPDNERRETLDMILKKYNDLISELNKMPVRTDTLKMKQRKIEIEKELDKLEEGIRVFSRSKVYVKLNA